MAKERLIAELEKPAAAEIIRVREIRFGERDLLDVRIFYSENNLEDGSMDWKPSRKGLGLSAETWRLLLPVIAEAVAEEKPQGEVYE